MRFGVLGPLAVWTEDGAPLRVPGLKVRALLADLLIHEGRPVSVDRLIDDLWGDTAPANPTGALQVRVSQLRRALEEAEAGARRLVVSSAGGYQLAVEPLGLAGEVRCDVPPLEVPDEGAGGDLERLARSSAVQLFVARASAAHSGFALDVDTGPAVARLCRRLDGIPLALELAATRVPALGVHGLVARLDDRFRLLTTGYRDAPQRQRTLTAVIDWSWQLLTEPERRVLRRLAVHSDGCTLEAAEAGCAGDDVAVEDVLDLLARLVDRSLVVVDDRSRGDPRYRLLESVAAYCVERMREAGELTRIRRRHARYYVDLAERARPHLRGHGQRRWLHRLDAEAANLRGALDTVVRSGAAEQALRLTGALAWYWFLRGRLTEARRSLAAALGVAGDALTAVRADALAWHAGIAALAGDTDGWATRLDAALRTYRDAGDPAGRARAAWFLGYLMVDLGELAASAELTDEARVAFEALGDRWGEAAALITTAKLAHVRGDLDALGADARRSAEMFRELGDHWGVLQATDWLIGLAEMTGDYEQATRLSRDGLRMAEELGLWPDAAGRLSYLGWISVQLGDYAQAQQWCEQALQLATEQGSRAGEAFATIGLAWATRRDGKLDLAEELLHRLVELARRQESEDGQALYLSMVLVELGFLAEQRDDSAAAVALHLEALGIAQEQDARRDTVWALEGLAAALALDGRHEDAVRLHGAARRGPALDGSGAGADRPRRGRSDRHDHARRARRGRVRRRPRPRTPAHARRGAIAGAARGRVRARRCVRRTSTCRSARDGPVNSMGCAVGGHGCRWIATR